MGGELLASGVQVQAAAQDDAVEAIQNCTDLRLLAERRDDDRQTARGHNRIEIAGGQTGVGPSYFAGGHEVGIDTNERPSVMGHCPPSLEPGAELRPATLRVWGSLPHTRAGEVYARGGRGLKI